MIYKNVNVHNQESMTSHGPRFHVQSVYANEYKWVLSHA